MRLRLAAFCGLAAYIAIGPFFPQILGVGRFAVRSWTMYTNFGSNICEVRYTRIEGTRRSPLDERALLGGRPGVRTIHDPGEAEAVGRALCRTIGAGADVRVWARCGAAGGWVQTLAADRDLCAAHRPARRGSRRPRTR